VEAADETPREGHAGEPDIINHKLCEELQANGECLRRGLHLMIPRKDLVCEMMGCVCRCVFDVACCVEMF
jgi:hypothetical protein